MKLEFPKRPKPLPGGKDATFEVPLSPSKNDAYVERTVKKGDRTIVMRHKKPAYVKYREDLAFEIRRLGLTWNTVRTIRLEVAIFFPDTPQLWMRDPQNHLDTICDSLEFAGLVKNDRQIKSHELVQSHVLCTPGRMLIRAFETEDFAKPQLGLAV